MEMLDKAMSWLEEQFKGSEERRQAFHKELQLSNEARAVLENPLIQRFFTINEEALDKKWKGTEPSQLKEREAAYEMLYLLNMFHQYFEQFMLSEEFALQQLAEMGKE